MNGNETGSVEYRKIPVISPGSIQLRKKFCVGLLAEGLISGGGA